MRAASRVRSRVVPPASRVLSWVGGVSFVFALLLASTGVRVSQAEAVEEMAFSWDPALEAAAGESAPVAPRRAPSAGEICSATQPVPVVMPSVRQLRGLQGIPLPAADEGEALNSLDGRGYNIGRSEPQADLQKLLAEVRRRQAR